MISIKDFSTALYALSKARGYTTTAVLTLGTLIAMFNPNYLILAALLPYADDDKLIVGSTAWLEKDGAVMYPRLLPEHVFRQPAVYALKGQ